MLLSKTVSECLLYKRGEMLGCGWDGARTMEKCVLKALLKHCSAHLLHGDRHCFPVADLQTWTIASKAIQPTKTKYLLCSFLTTKKSLPTPDVDWNNTEICVDLSLRETPQSCLLTSLALTNFSKEQIWGLLAGGLQWMGECTTRKAGISWKPHWGAWPVFSFEKEGAGHGE
jgi:hypothetical protein